MKSEIIVNGSMTRLPNFPDIEKYLEKPKCPACGLEMGEYMAYVCSRDVCPSGLGSYVSMSC